MTTRVDEIAPEIFRIATMPPGVPLAFVQFLIRDEQPMLYHTGGKAIFEDTLAAVRDLVDPSKLRYLGWSHLEQDECGAMNGFLALAPDARPVHSPLAQTLGVDDFFDRPLHAVPDGNVLELGEKRLRFLTTPHVPHAWDAIMAYEETTGTLFVSDLFTAFGATAAVTDGDVVEPALAVLEQLPDYLPIGPHTAAVFERLEALQPRVLAGHHSPAYTGDAVQALRDLKGEMFRRAGMAP